MVQSVAGFYGTVTEVQEAQRFALAVARAIVDTPASFKPTPQGARSLSIAAGSMLCNGVLFIESAAQVIQLPTNTAAGVRLDVVGLRFTWNGASSMVELFSKQGTAGSTTRPTLTRNPGSVYEFPIAVVRVRQNVGTIAAADVLDVRVWGGFGGSFQMLQDDNIGVVDLPLGGQIQVGTSTYAVTANDGNGNSTLSLISAAATPWIAYDPVLFTGSLAACNLGAGGVRRGFYQLKDGTCHVRFEIRKGTGSVNFGTSNFGVLLPAAAPVSTAFTDQWGDGVMNTNSGDGFYNWPVKYLLRAESPPYAVPYTPTAGNDTRMLPAQSANPDGTPGSIPILLSGPGGTRQYNDVNVLTGAFSYMVA